ncbi:Cytidine and deoxycytidylate deaminase zinc-binding domain-containing protein [Cladophialophora immunda]|nr:Cytidine and deoxycytidylate deaminase zinc-binding domain-containing protein [Cladophialophora immunda]
MTGHERSSLHMIIVRIYSGTGEGDRADQLGVEVCIGANSLVRDGNPTLHGEIAAINNCSRILTDPDGPYKLSGPEALQALSDLSLYTTAEACPMCSSAILYGGFREYIFSTSIPTLRSLSWPQIVIRSREIFSRSVGRLSVHRTRIIGDVLANETEQLFKWQYADGECPSGCEKKEGSGCVKPTTLNNSTGKDEL